MADGLDVVRSLMVRFIEQIAWTILVKYYLPSYGGDIIMAYYSGGKMVRYGNNGNNRDNEQLTLLKGETSRDKFND